MIKASDLSADMRAKLGIKPRNKYNVSSKDTRTADGIVFDSKKEKHEYVKRTQMMRAGVLRFTLMQVPFRLPGGIKYLLDFVDFYPDGRVEFVEVKGKDLPLGKAKRKMAEDIYKIQIRVV